MKEVLRVLSDCNICTLQDLGSMLSDMMTITESTTLSPSHAEESSVLSPQMREKKTKRGVRGLDSSIYRTFWSLPVILCYRILGKAI